MRLVETPSTNLCFYGLKRKITPTRNIFLTHAKQKEKLR